MDVQVPSGKRFLRNSFTAAQAACRAVAFETPHTPPCPNKPNVQYSTCRKHQAPPLGFGLGVSIPWTTGPATSRDWPRRGPPWRSGRLNPCFLHCRHLSLQTRMALKHHAAPQFFWILTRLGEGAPRRAPAAVLRADTHRREPDFGVSPPRF